MQWYCRLLGRPKLEQTGRVIERFRTQKTTLLLGYLAYHLGQWYERTALADRFWGDARDPDASLRTALSALRRLMEPVGVPVGSVLQATGGRLRLNPEAVGTDVQQFCALLRHAQATSQPSERRRLLTEALELYQGELLQGYESEWLLEPRAQLEQLYLEALGEALPLLLEQGEIDIAQALAESATRIYPLSEQAARLTIRLYLSLNQQKLAQAAYERYRQMLGRILGDYPQFTLGMLQTAVWRVGTIRQTLPAAPPALKVRPRAAVPAPLTRCYGREQEIEQVIQWLHEGIRLITLTGPPGIGKTRLGQEVGLRLESELGGRVFWISLREARSLAEAHRAFAQAFGCENALPTDASTDALLASIGDAPALLITDAWEHALDALPLLVELLQRLPRLQVLAMSRHMLALPGERWLALKPLPVPEPEAPLETLLTNPSVALFVDGAQSVRPDFALTPAVAPRVAQLCRLLEGVPLALELAAGQLSRHSLNYLLERIHDRLDWFQNRRRSGGYPYPSLHAALDSSFALLAPHAQQAFLQLAFLKGDWDETLATAVLGEPAGPLVEELLHCSLIQGRWESERLLYRMLDSVRLFGQRKGEARQEAVLARLFEYFEQLGKQVRTEFNLESQFAWLARLRVLYPNLSQAMDWAVERIPRRAAHTLVDYGYFLDWEQRWEQGRVWCTQLLHSGALTRRQRAQLLSWLGLFLLRMEQYDRVEALLRESIHLCQQVRDWDELAGAYNMLGLLYTEQQRFAEAACAFARGVESARRHARPIILAPILHNWGLMHYRNGDYARALTHAHEALQLYDQIRAGLPLANTLNLLGCCHFQQRQWAQAETYFQQALAQYQAANYPAGVAIVYANLAELALERNALSDAATWLQHAQASYQQSGGSLRVRVNLLLLQARLAQLQGEMNQAERLLQQCHEIAERAPRLQPLIKQRLQNTELLP